MYSLHLVVSLVFLAFGEPILKPNIRPHVLEATAEEKAEYVASLLRKDVCSQENSGASRSLFRRSISTLESMQYLVYLLKECNEKSGQIATPNNCKTDGSTYYIKSQQTSVAKTTVPEATSPEAGASAAVTEVTTSTTNPSLNVSNSQADGRTSTTQAETTAGVTSTTTTTEAFNVPIQCTSSDTVTLSEWWRKDANGSNIKPINGDYACDSPRLSSKWFRFQGAAGRQLANSCRPDYSCGTHVGFWTNAAMPTTVGESLSVPLYGSWSNNCTWLKLDLTVLRCSPKPGDFVYFHPKLTSCHHAPCGMD